MMALADLAVVADAPAVLAELASALGVEQGAGDDVGGDVPAASPASGGRARG